MANTEGKSGTGEWGSSGPKNGSMNLGNKLKVRPKGDPSKMALPGGSAPRNGSAATIFTETETDDSSWEGCGDSD